MPDVHAKQFSPSASCKWLNCPGSVALEAQFPDASTAYADEGSLAHSIAELKLRKKFTAGMSQRSYATAMNKFKKDERYQDEMQGYTDTYVDYVTEIAMRFPSQPYVAIEQQLSFEKYAPGGFGTSDCVVIGCQTMYVVDFKYGKGVPVSAERNSQGMLYALGAVEYYSILYDIRDIVIAIVQPRLDNISEYRIKKDEMLHWGEETVAPAVKRVLSGDAACVAGPWCDKGFCKARGRCRAQSMKNTALEEFRHALPPLLSDAEVGEILTRAEGLKKWVAELEEYALKAILEGKQIAGWKAVEGRRVRTFTDVDKAFEHLQHNGIQKDMLYERKPLSLTGVEKLVGKKEFAALMGDYITIPSGKPTLAAESDAREPYSVTNAASDFAEAAGK